MRYIWEYRVSLSDPNVSIMMFDVLYFLVHQTLSSIYAGYTNMIDQMRVNDCIV